MKQFPIDLILSEQVLIGGEVLTRRQVRDELRSEGWSERTIDFFAFGYPTLTPRELAEMEANRQEAQRRLEVSPQK